MKILELFESASDSKPEVLKAKRMMKFSVKNGENSLGVDLANLKCEYYSFGRVVYIGKPGSLREGVNYVFENADKPGFSATYNQKLPKDASGSTFIKKADTVQGAIKLIKERSSTGYSSTTVAVIIDPDLTKDAKPAEPKKSDDPQSIEDGYFLLGYWDNAYGRSRDDREYFWAGPFQDRKSAAAYGKRKQERGQPRGFRDWVKGTSSVIRGLDKFVAAAKKVKLNPNVKDLEWFE